MVRQAFLFSCILFLLLEGVASGRVPLLLNYQGHLQATADSLQTDPILVTFSIYDSQRAENPLWSELHQVEVQDGLFHVLLGSRVPFPDTLFAGPARYLGIRVQGEQEFDPRQQIVSVAYALRAATAEAVEGEIAPSALKLSNGKAALDSLGVLTASRVHTDSLNVGGKGVIDRDGNWRGVPILAQTTGMVLDTLIVKSFRDTLIFASRRFRDLDGDGTDLTTFFRLKRPAVLDIQFHLNLTANGNLFQTRLVAQPIDPSGPLNTDIGNTSSTTPPSSTATFSVSNAGVLALEPGLHRISVEGQIEGASTLQTGILTVRIFSR